MTQNTSTTTQHISFVIECTFQTNHDHWQKWSVDDYTSYNLALKELDRLAAEEVEFYSSSSGKTYPPKIYGFRIIQKIVSTTTEVRDEILF